MLINVTNDLSDIAILPANVLEEIAQNVRSIIATAKTTVPLDREFGIDSQLIDEPIAAAQAKLTAEIAASIRRFEPRARLKKATYSGDADGKLIINATIEVSL